MPLITSISDRIVALDLGQASRAVMRRHPQSSARRGFGTWSPQRGHRRSGVASKRTLDEADRSGRGARAGQSATYPRKLRRALRIVAGDVGRVSRPCAGWRRASSACCSRRSGLRVSLGG
jgi:hypothetical protein